MFSDIFIIWLMWSVKVCLKVIPLSNVYCSSNYTVSFQGLMHRTHLLFVGLHIWGVGAAKPGDAIKYCENS
jgi:hypothetical protein